MKSAITNGQLTQVTQVHWGDKVFTMRWPNEPFGRVPQQPQGVLVVHGMSDRFRGIR